MAKSRNLDGYNNPGTNHSSASKNNTLHGEMNDNKSPHPSIQLGVIIAIVISGILAMGVIVYLFKIKFKKKINNRSMNSLRKSFHYMQRGSTYLNARKSKIQTLNNASIMLKFKTGNTNVSKFLNKASKTIKNTEERVKNVIPDGEDNFKTIKLRNSNINKVPTVVVYSVNKSPQDEYIQGNDESSAEILRMSPGDPDPDKDLKQPELMSNIAITQNNTFKIQLYECNNSSVHNDISKGKES